MKRGTALLLAMAALFAHALAIHLDELHRFGTPPESVHVAYHLARNFVREGELAWNVGMEGTLRGGLGSYSSPLWVLVAIVAELRWISVTVFTQMVGMAAAFLTVAVSTRFTTDRVAGVVPALLLVSSGSFAAAAASGTEYPLAALLFATSFVAFEHRRPRWLAISLAGLAATRPEAVVIVPGFLALVLAERVVPRGDGGKPMSAWTILPAILVLSGLIGRELTDLQRPYTSLLTALPSFGGVRAETGALYVLDCLKSGGLPILMIFPVVAIATRRISGAGLRALALALLWMLTVVVEGGGPQSFGMGLVPCLPVLAIAIQQGIVAGLDSRLPGTEKLSWALLLLGVLVTVVASKFPGNLGPLQTQELNERWMTGSAEPPYGREPLLGRASLQREMNLARELRDLGAFLRSSVSPEYTILSPYPGVIGYLSGMRVLDLFGRVVCPPGTDPRPAWDERGDIDLAANLALEPDFIQPGRLYSVAQERAGLVRGLDPKLAALDRSPSAAREPRTLVRDYELVTLPLRRGYGSSRGKIWPTLLLRRRGLGMTPVLDLQLEGDRLRIEARQGRGDDEPHSSTGGGHPQLIRLIVIATNAKGESFRFDPSGALTPANKRACARTWVNLVPSRRGPTRLIELRVPTSDDGDRIVEIRARLVNPGIRETHPLAPASAEVVVRL